MDDITSATPIQQIGNSNKVQATHWEYENIGLLPCPPSFEDLHEVQADNNYCDSIEYFDRKHNKIQPTATGAV